jgi:hypothetical protein
MVEMAVPVEPERAWWREGRRLEGIVRAIKELAVRNYCCEDGLVFSTPGCAECGWSSSGFDTGVARSPKWQKWAEI